MDPKLDDMAAYVDAATSLLGIHVAPEWRAGVTSHLAIILANAELVTEHEGSSTSEPAQVFEAS